MVNDKEDKPKTTESICLEHLLTLVDNLEESFFSVDCIKRKVTYSSRATLKIYGYPRENFLEDPMFWFKVIHPDDKERVMAQEPLLANGKTLIREYRIIKLNGCVKWVQNKVIPTLDKEGKLIRLDGYTVDIDERKRAEIKLENYNTLMYQISHDLRGPLNTAKNYIAIGLDKVKGEPAHTYFSKINESYNRLESHVLSLLDLGRLNRTESIIEQIELLPMIRNIIGSMEGNEGFESIKFNTEVKVSGDFYSDRQYLQSIIYNLISNAIKFRKDACNSFVNISLSTENDNTVIRVADNGRGMPQEVQDKAFNIFAKGSTSNKGSGLGLYIIMKLVKKLKGEIQLESKENEGTTFTITLPKLK
jgi:PAS domain S-box-containing protein